MFEGSLALSLDAKGRFAIPSRHRESLAVFGAEGLVLTAHPHRCLLLYPESAWLPIRDQIVRVSGLDPRAAAIKRVLVGNARLEIPDAAGRMLIASELRDYAGMEKTIYMVGMGSHFEIWSEAGWKEQNALAAKVFSGELPPGFEELVL